jgi:hypothetical protein
MKNFLLSVSFFAWAVASAADLPYWVEPCTHPETGCIASDVELASWALQAWEQASGGRLRLVKSDREHARLRLVWALPTEGLYGETVPIMVGSQRGSQINIRIEDGGTPDPLMRATVVYLTCLHESGHALGLAHTRGFADIMYSFQYGGDIPEYFGRYRRRLTVREDIKKNPGLSADDRASLIATLK